MSDFTYASVAELPKSASSGRTAKPNPHAEAAERIAHTDGVLSFELPDPDKGAAADTVTKKRDLLVAKHRRLLRAAFVELDRNVRVVPTVNDKAGTITLSFQSRELKARKEK